MQIPFVHAILCYWLLYDHTRNIIFSVKSYSSIIKKFIFIFITIPCRKLERVLFIEH